MSGPKKPLPHGWTVQFSKTYPGLVFYYNKITKCTTWNLPIASGQSEPRPPSPKEKPKNYFLTDVDPDTCSESSSKLVIDETVSVRSSLVFDSKAGKSSQEEEFGKTKKAPLAEKASTAGKSVEVPNSTVPLKPTIKDPSVIPKPKNIGVTFSKEKQLRIIPPRTTVDNSESLSLQCDSESLEERRGSDQFQPPKHIFTKPPSHASLPASSRHTKVDSLESKISPDLNSQSSQRSGYKIPKKIHAAVKDKPMNHSPLLLTERPSKTLPKLETQQKRNIYTTTHKPVSHGAVSDETPLFLESECSLYSELPAPKFQASNPPKMLSEDELYPDSDTIEYKSPKPTSSRDSKSTVGSGLNSYFTQKLGSPERVSRKRRAQKDPTTPPDTSMRVDFASALIRIPNKENSVNSSSSSSNSQESNELKKSHPKSARFSNPPSNSSTNSGYKTNAPMNHSFREQTTASQSGELPKSSKPFTFPKFPSFDSLTPSSFLGPNTSFASGLKPLNSEIQTPNVFKPLPSLMSITLPFEKPPLSSQSELSRSSTSNQTGTKQFPTFDTTNDSSSRHSNESSSALRSSSLGPPQFLNLGPSTSNQAAPLLETANNSASKQLNVTDLRVKLDCKRLLSNKSTSTVSSKSLLFSDRFDEILFDSDMPNMKFTSIPEPSATNSFKFDFNPNTSVMPSASLSINTPISRQVTTPISQSINTPISQLMNTTFSQFSTPINSFSSPVNTESCKSPTKRLTSLPVPRPTPQEILPTPGKKQVEGRTTTSTNPEEGKGDTMESELENTAEPTLDLLSQLPTEGSECRIKDWQIPSPCGSPPVPSESAQSVRSFGDYWAPKTAVEEMEEAMDWEADNSLLSPPASKDSENLDDMYKHLQHKSWHIVVDTNIFIEHLDFLTEVRDTPYKDRGLPTIVFPYVVFQELDNQKDRNRRKEKKGDKIDQPTVNKVHAAISFINTNLNSEHPRFLGQSLGEHLQQEEVFKGSVNNDDRILHFCSTLQKKGIQVSLLTEDRNLRSKALASRIEAMSKADLQRLGKVTKIAEMVITPPSPPDSDKEKPRQHNMEATKAEKIFCQIKVILSDVLKDVLQKGMQAEFNSMWSRLIIKKPPWTLDDLIYCLKYHWMSVFGNKLPKTSLELVTDIEEALHKYKMRKGFSHTLSDMGNFVDICIQLMVSFYKLSFVNEKVKAAVQKLSQLKELCSGEHSGDSMSSEGSTNQQLHQAPPCETPTSMRSCENSFNEPEWSEVKIAQDEQLQVQAVQQHLQALFEKINVFCNKLENLQQISTQNPALLNTIEKELSPNHRLVKLFLQLNDKILDKSANKSSKEISELHSVLMSEKFDYLEQEGFEEPFSKDALTLFYHKNSEILKTAQDQFKNFNKKLNTGVRYFMAKAANETPTNVIPM